MDIQKTSPDISAENSPKTAHTAEAIATVRADVVARAAGYAAEYLAGVDERGVAPATAAVDALAELCGAVPEGSTDAAAVVEMLHRVGSPGTVASSGGRYFGFVVGGMVPAALGAGVLANAWNQNAGMQAQTPTAAILEATAVRWVAELLGLPEGTGGAVVTGATMANFCGLAAARHALLERAGGGWVVWRSADYGGGGRRGSQLCDQGSGDARDGTPAGGAGSGGWAGAYAD